MFVLPPIRGVDKRSSVVKINEVGSVFLASTILVNLSKHMKSKRKLSVYNHKCLSVASALIWLMSIRLASALDYPSTVLADHPLAYYRLEETSGYVAADSSASGAFPADYIVNGAFPFLGWPGIDTNAIAVSSSLGFANYVSAGYYPEFNQPGPFSFEVWARPVSFPTGGDYRCPIGNSAAYSTATQSGWYVYQTPAPGSTFALVTPTGDVFITYPNYTLNTWYYLAGTYDGTNMSFYVNGVLVGTQAASAYVANSVNNAGACTFALGQRGAGYGNWDGELDEGAFYTNALTLAQIQSHYEAGTNMFRANTEPPLIFTEPASASVNAGQTAQFSVLADGAGPLTYQWYRGTSSIPGETNATYSFTTILGDDGSTYSVAITNSFGYAISTEATLTVTASLEIVAPLTSITRYVGSAAAFEIVAKGAGPITYQWRDFSDSSPIPGQTNSVLWLPNVQLTDNNRFVYVTVSNPFTSIDSIPALLTVQDRPVNVPVNGYAKVVMADGPIAFWQLDEPSGSTVAVDTAGSFDGSYVAGSGSFTFGAPTGIPNDTNAALGVTGGATVSIPYAIEINPLGAFSVEGWFKPASLASNGNDYRTALSSMSNPYGIGPTGWLVYQTAGNNWSWWPYNGFYTGVQLTDPDTVVANQWYYIALTYDGTTFTLYVNGVAKASGTDSGYVQNGNVPPGGEANYNYNYNQGAGLPLGSGPYTLGWRYDSGFNPFSGVMDDVAVYNKSLTPQQIQNHFMNTTRLSITSSGSNVIISWPTGTLQSSTNVLGTYVDVSGATSPYTNSVGGTQKFFRVRLQ